MKKKLRALSMILSLSLLITIFGGTGAFAEETIPTTITFTNGFDTVTTVELSTLNYYELEVNKPELTLEAKTSDESVLKVKLQKDSENSIYYSFVLTAYKNGEAVITFTASDGTSIAQTVTVEGTGTERNYTISSDPAGDFSIPKGNSRIIKIHYVSDDLDTITYPVLVTDEQSANLKITQIDVDYDNNDYYFRVEALGNEGQTGILYMSGSHYIPVKLSTVTITANKNLRLDTTSTYVCNVYDSYRFVAYTSSATAPEVSSYNDRIFVEYVGKVAGGYEYRMDTDEEGESMVQATLNGETASFGVFVNYNNPPSIKSDTPKKITLAQGSSYTYKFTIMGGSEPIFVADIDSVLSIQSVKKDGINYYCKVTAIGESTNESSLLVTFPDSGDDDVNIGDITVTAPKVTMKSDTNANFTIKQGASYTFKITNATSFSTGTYGVFKTELVKKIGADSFYKITAIGKPGQATGFYMALAGQPTQKVCAVTVGAATGTTIIFKSDTNSDFAIAQKATYQFKITAPGAKMINFCAGTAGVYQVALVKHTGDDFFYKITAVGKRGQETGLYVSVPGQSAKKLCKVSIL